MVVISMYHWGEKKASIIQLSHDMTRVGNPEVDATGGLIERLDRQHKN